MKKLLVVSVLLLSSCAAEIERSMPVIVLQSPEGSGGWPTAEIGGGFTDSTYVLADGDATVIAPDRATPKITRDRAKLMVHGGIGLAPNWLDFWFDSTQRASLKAQVLGKSFKEAEAGNFSTSILLTVGAKNKRGSGEGMGILSNSTSVDYSMLSTDWRGGVLVGYRLSPKFLLYTGAFYRELKYSGDFRYATGSSGRFAGFANSRSVNTGAEFNINKTLLGRLEHAYSVEKIPSVGAVSSSNSIGFSLTAKLNFELND